MAILIALMSLLLVGPASGWEWVFRWGDGERLARAPCRGWAPGRRAGAEPGGAAGDGTGLRRWQPSTSRTPRCCSWASSAWRPPWRSGTCISASLCAWSSWLEPSQACKWHFGASSRQCMLPAPRGPKGQVRFRSFSYQWGWDGPRGSHLSLQWKGLGPWDRVDCVILVSLIVSLNNLAEQPRLQGQQVIKYKGLIR